MDPPNKINKFTANYRIPQFTHYLLTPMLMERDERASQQNLITEEAAVLNLKKKKKKKVIYTLFFL